MRQVKEYRIGYGSVLNEIGQASTVRFSLGVEDSEGNLVQVSPWFKCRDYFNEVAAIEGGHVGFKSCKVFGFQYPASNDFPRWRAENSACILIKDLAKWDANELVRADIIGAMVEEDLWYEAVQVGKTEATAMWVPEGIITHPTRLHALTWLFRILDYRNTGSISGDSVEELLEPLHYKVDSSDGMLAAVLNEAGGAELLYEAINRGHEFIEVLDKDPHSVHSSSGIATAATLFLGKDTTVASIGSCNAIEVDKEKYEKGLTRAA